MFYYILFCFDPHCHYLIPVSHFCFSITMHCTTFSPPCTSTAINASAESSWENNTRVIRLNWHFVSHDSIQSLIHALAKYGCFDSLCLPFNSYLLSGCFNGTTLQGHLVGKSSHSSSIKNWICEIETYVWHMVYVTFVD